MNLKISISDTHARAVGEGLLDKSWPAADWHHAEHCIATLYLVRERTDFLLATALPGIIQLFNRAHGGENTETAGYHHTMTLFYLSEIQNFTANNNSLALGEACEALLSSDIGEKDHVFRYWSRDNIMSPAARLCFVAPDIGPVKWSHEVEAILPHSSTRPK